MNNSELSYPDFPDLWDESVPGPQGEWYKELFDALVRYSRLACELGHSEDSQRIVDGLREKMQQSVDEFRQIARTAVPDPSEPEDLESIRAARPAAPHRLTDKLPQDYRDRWFGSILGRGAGCTLGAALEFRSVDEMRKWALYSG